MAGCDRLVVTPKQPLNRRRVPGRCYDMRASKLAPRGCRGWKEEGAPMAIARTPAFSQRSLALLVFSSYGAAPFSMLRHVVPAQVLSRLAIDESVVRTPAKFDALARLFRLCGSWTWSYSSRAPFAHSTQV
jgi:hypothetical protein